MFLSGVLFYAALGFIGKRDDLSFGLALTSFALAITAVGA